MKKISIAEPEIIEILRSGNAKQEIHRIFRDVHPFEIFSLIEGMEPEYIASIITYIGFPLGAEVFEHFDDEDREDIFDHFNRKDMIKMIEEMSSDERVDLLKILDDDLVKSLMPLIAQAERNDIKKLSEYSEGTAGSIMTTEYASLKEEMTIDDGLRHLRMIAPDKETIYSIFITDNSRKLKGVLSLEKLFLTKSSHRISEIMNREFIFVSINDDQEDVSRIMADYDLLAVPVVDAEKMLLGIITVDDIVDVVIEEDTEDFLRHGSVEGDVDYLSANPFKLARQRIVWLLLLVLVGFISGYIMELNHEILQSVIALAFFLPLLSGSAGNAGTQSSTIVIRGLATGELEMSDIKHVIFKEMATGVIVGVVLGLASGLRAILLNGDFRLAFTVSVSMVFVVFCSTLLGAVLPVVFKKMKLDPALMSAPFIASIIDILSIFIYLNIASMVYAVQI